MLARVTFPTILAVVVLLLNACSDGGSSDDDAPPMTMEPPADTTAISVDLDANQVVVAATSPAPGGDASADLLLNNDDNTLSGTVTVTGVDATSVTLRRGFAGNDDGELVALTDNGGGEWAIPPNTVLTDDDLDALDNGALYLRVSANGSVALRGQILTGSTEIIRVALNSMQNVPLFDADASGVGFVTINRDSNLFVAHVNNQGVDNAAAGHVHQAFAGNTGPIVIDLTQDNEDPGHWFSEAPTLDGEDLDDEMLDNVFTALDSGALYFNIHTEANNFAGTIRGQIVPDDIELVGVELTSLQNVPIFNADAGGVGFLTLDRNAPSVVAHINTQGVDDAVAAHIHEGLAGDTGPVIIDLIQDDGDVGHWFTEDPTLDNNALTDDDINNAIAAFDDAALYFNIHTSANNFAGTIRAQIGPPDIGVIFTELTGDEASVTTTARAVAALTLTIDSGAADAFVNTSELEDAMSVSLNQAPAGETGPSIVDFNLPDVMDSRHWAATDLTLTDDELGLLGDDGLYYLVTTPDFPNGEVRGQLIAPNSLSFPDAPDNGGSNATFTFIQNNVFSPICAECHAGASPRAGLDLSEGQAYGNIVEVASGQVPELFRIDPGNPDDSYLVRKIEGTNSVGGRMPLDGPFLDQETIDTIRQWVSEGAQNN